MGLFDKIFRIFGPTKREKDITLYQPNVAHINAFFEEYKSLSNDELREKTEVVEDPRYTRDYADPAKRASANAVHR